MFPGFNGHDLSGNEPLEAYPISANIDIIDEVLTNRSNDDLTVTLSSDVFNIEDINIGSILLENEPPNHSEIIGSELELTFDNKEIFEIMDDYYKRGDYIKLHLTGYLGGEDSGWFIGSDFMEYNPGLKKPTTAEIVLPEDFALLQNYPNPFNPETEIGFMLPEVSTVELKIYNSLGQEIRTLVNANYDQGYHHVKWNGRDNFGNAVLSGIYFYKLQAGEFTQMKKMTLMR